MNRTEATTEEIIIALVDAITDHDDYVANEIANQQAGSGRSELNRIVYLEDIAAYAAALVRTFLVHVEVDEPVEQITDADREWELNERIRDEEDQVDAARYYKDEVR